jgi:Base plate wedge protein 53
MFFENFPYTTFRIDRNSSILVQDIIRGIRLDPRLKEDSVHWFPYSMKDEETPEMVSYKFYKSTQYHWVIMLLNERFDFINDFPHTYDVINRFALRKYDDVNGTHHYEASDGEWVDEFTPLANPITNLEFEQQVNESKRLIKVLKPELLTEFVSMYEALINV